MGGRGGGLPPVHQNSLECRVWMAELLGPSGPCLQAATHLFSQTSHIPGEKLHDSDGTKEAQSW